MQALANDRLVQRQARSARRYWTASGGGQSKTVAIISTPDDTATAFADRNGEPLTYTASNLPKGPAPYGASQLSFGFGWNNGMVPM